MGLSENCQTNWGISRSDLGKIFLLYYPTPRIALSVGSSITEKSRIIDTRIRVKDHSYVYLSCMIHTCIGIKEHINEHCGYTHHAYIHQAYMRQGS